MLLDSTGWRNTIILLLYMPLMLILILRTTQLYFTTNVVAKNIHIKHTVSRLN